MFICYLLKTILNKIQTMYSQLALTHACPRSLILFLSLTLILSALALSLSFAYCRQGLPRHCNWNVFGPVVVCVLLLFPLLLLWVAFLAGWLLFCCVVSLENDAACLYVYVCMWMWVWQRRFLIGWVWRIGLVISPGPDVCKCCSFILLFLLFCSNGIRRSSKLHTAFGLCGCGRRTCNH